MSNDENDKKIIKKNNLEKLMSNQANLQNSWPESWN